MIKRFLTAAISVLASLPAAAGPVSHCDGKYAGAAELVTAAVAQYGTLYSGGDHWHSIDNVGATLDLYRFWRGNPDIGLRHIGPYEFNSENDFPYGWNQDLSVDDVWARAQLALSPETLADGQRRNHAWAAWGFDTLTSPGPSPDWWHHPEAFENLTIWQRWVAQKAKTEPALDWLQAVLTASDAPWANHWHLADGASEHILSAYRRLADAAYARFEAGDGIEWLVASAINNPDLHANYPLDQSLKQIHDGISSCNASAEAYAAYAISQAARERFHQSSHARGTALLGHLPDVIRRNAETNRLYRFVVGTLRRHVRERPEQADRIISDFLKFAPDDSAWRETVEMAQLYTAADTIDHVPLSNHAYARRAYNLLSADNLVALARRDGLEPSLIRAAFARYVALENWSEAETLLEELKTATPDQAESIDRLWSLRHSKDVRLSLIALHTPNLSTLITGENNRGDARLFWYQRDVHNVRNLPREYASGGVLQRDFEVWLRLPQRWRAYRGMRGFSIDWIERQSQRDRSRHFRYLQAPLLIPDRPSNNGANFERLIAWGEIGRLTGNNRLMHSVARVIVAWADRRTNTRLKRTFVDHTVEADALARLVHICRFNSCGEIESQPAQKRAFEILHYRLPDTEATETALYWWKSPIGR